MPATDAMATPAAMERGGFYNDHAQHQAAGGAHGMPLIPLAFEGMTPAEPIVIADYGSAQGRNSLGPVAAALGEVRRTAGAGVPVSVVHTDQPGNDFTALFELLRDDEASYLRDDPAVFASCVGRSFYGQILPPASVTFGWCSFAAHWLSAAPVADAGHLWARMTRPEVRRLFAARSAADWRTFLACRARELRPGGCLVVVQPSLREDEPTTFPVLMGWAQAELEDMERTGLLRPAERARMTVLLYERHPSDVRAPFADGDFEGLRLKAEEVREMPDPLWPAYVADGDATALADRHLGFFRAPFNPSLLAALDGDRDAAFRAGFTAGLETALRRRMVAAPQPLLSPMTIHAVLLQKAAAA